MALVSHVCAGKHSLNGLFNRLYKVSKYNNVQVARITGKLNRTHHHSRPAPFPYREKKFGFFEWFFGYNIERFDDNSRIVVIEGPPTAGKDKFARELAKELEMAYMPPPTFDRIFIDDYGNDIRSIQHEYPEKVHICDLPTLLSNPNHPNAQVFQVSNYVLKFEDYAESLLHVLSTGEGVVLNRCLYSNFVFMKAMYNAGYMNQKSRQFYEKVVTQSLPSFMRPHLVIYLDVPVNIVQERIKRRAIPYEVNSKLLTKKFLTDVETIYKEEYLPYIENHAFLLMYDWSNGGDISDVVEDIERINIEHDAGDEDKLKDWTFATISDLQKRRKLFSHEERTYLTSRVLVADFDVDRVFLHGEEAQMREEMFSRCHSTCAKGYNVAAGDKVLWKTKQEFCIGSRVLSNKELLSA